MEARKMANQALQIQRNGERNQAVHYGHVYKKKRVRRAVLYPSQQKTRSDGNNYDDQGEKEHGAPHPGVIERHEKRAQEQVSTLFPFHF
jgi:hypothetical protein